MIGELEVATGCGVVFWNRRKGIMDNTKLEQAIEVMRAYANGDEIEVQLAGSCNGWRPCSRPVWNWDVSEYRIKQEEQLLPFTWDKREQLRGRWIENAKSGYAFLITGVRKYEDNGVEVLAGDFWILAGDLLEDWQFSGGQPCGLYQD